LYAATSSRRRSASALIARDLTPHSIQIGLGSRIARCGPGCNGRFFLAQDLQSSLVALGLDFWGDAGFAAGCLYGCSALAFLVCLGLGARRAAQLPRQRVEVDCCCHQKPPLRLSSSAAVCDWKK
jgi:hypothetical protein